MASLYHALPGYTPVFWHSGLVPRDGAFKRLLTLAAQSGRYEKDAFRMPVDLSARIALVTGASRGIGYATARALARAGAHVIAVARTQAGLEELDDAIRADGGNATLVPLDMTDLNGIARLGAALNERHGKLDILIGNAGVAGTSSPLGHTDPKFWDNMFAVNTTANFQLIRCMEPLLQKSDAGRAVFITSGERDRNDTDPRQPVQPRTDPHPQARHRDARRGPDDPRHTGTGRRIHCADVRTVLDRDRKVLRLPVEDAQELSHAGRVTSATRPRG